MLDLSGFEEMHCKNNDEKFKTGEIVKYVGGRYTAMHPELSQYLGQTFEVRAVNRCDEDSVEYFLAGLPYLVWEEELEKV